MALITCPHCGKQVSDSVDTCIHCGGQLKEKTEPKKEVIFDHLPEEERKALKEEYERIDPRLAEVEKKMNVFLIIAFFSLVAFVVVLIVGVVLVALGTTEVIGPLPTWAGVLIIVPFAISVVLMLLFHYLCSRVTSREYPIYYEGFRAWLKAQKGITETINYSERQRITLQNHGLIDQYGGKNNGNHNVS